MGEHTPFIEYIFGHPPPALSLFSFCFLFFLPLPFEGRKKRKRSKGKRNTTGAAGGLHAKRGSVFGDSARMYDIAKRNEFFLNFFSLLQMEYG